MIAVRLHSRAHVESVLRGLGCRPSGFSLPTAELWEAPDGHRFFVPTEGPDRRCDEYALERIVAEIERYRGIVEDE